MNTVAGYAMSGWDTGYGDMVMKPDLTTLRRIPWLPGTAHGARRPGVARRQPDRARAPSRPAPPSWNADASAGCHAFAGTELEFMVFDDTYRQAWANGYRDLTPASRLQHGLLRCWAPAASSRCCATSAASMYGAGLRWRGVKGECNRGQQEIAFRYDEALITCDNHAIYKNGAKEIADQHGKSLTFMAKYDEREGNSCHIHMSLRGSRRCAVFADDDQPLGMSQQMFAALSPASSATLRELTLFYAPNINSYKRFADRSFAPTVVAWGLDNRTCALRVVGHRDGMRVECRVPGGDVNQYLAVARMIAGGLNGIECELPLPEPCAGNAYSNGRQRRRGVPGTLAEAAALFDASAVARQAFGDAVVDHYVNNARVEVAAFNAAVTDWERVRGFERL